jgi:hypothetical protein
MRTSYLMVSRWEGSKGKDCPELRRRTGASGPKATSRAREYESQLNKGLRFDMQEVVRGKALFSVCPIPFSQAREYRDFPEWENCPVFPGVPVGGARDNDRVCDMEKEA